jgi:hypothetical protein
VFYARADNISYDFDVYSMAAYNPAYVHHNLSDFRPQVELLFVTVLFTNNSNSSEEGPDARQL